jgi:flagellar motility protein MotE (MotC chaperone)
MTAAMKADVGARVTKVVELLESIERDYSGSIASSVSIAIDKRLNVDHLVGELEGIDADKLPEDIRVLYRAAIASLQDLREERGKLLASIEDAVSDYLCAPASESAKVLADLEQALDNQPAVEQP